MPVLPIEPRHRAAWDRLYAGYAEFYRVEQSAQMRDIVWAWLHDPGHELGGLIAEDAAGQAVGLAHWRPYARPLRATTAMFLDDLFVDPAARGSGAAPGLLAALRGIARGRGWETIRWITADDNHRARTLYDKHATRTWWVTYDMAAGAP
jgi:GNAT superfamily N-acetyltransferase